MLLRPSIFRVPVPHFLAWIPRITAIFLKQFLTLEDGQFRPKHAVFKDFIK
jgi:hypothetical protein